MKATNIYIELDGPMAPFVISQIRHQLRELLDENQYEVELITLETGFVTCEAENPPERSH